MCSMCREESSSEGADHGLIKYKGNSPKCRLYWCSIEFIDGRYSQSCWNFRPSLWTIALSVKWTSFYVLKSGCSKRNSLWPVGLKIETKRFLSVQENLGSNAFVLLHFQIFFETIKSFFLSLKNPGAIWNVLVSFCYNF